MEDAKSPRHALHLLVQLKKEFEHEIGKDGGRFSTYVLWQLSEIEWMLQQVVKGSTH